MIKLQVSIASNGSVKRPCGGTNYKNCMNSNGCNDLFNGEIWLRLMDIMIYLK